MNEENPISTYYNTVNSSQTCLNSYDLIKENFEKEIYCELLKVQTNTRVEKNIFWMILV